MLFRSFLEHGLEVPVSGSRDQVVWRRPRYSTIYTTLTNPAYAGAYAYGRTEHSLQYEQGQPRRRSRRKPRPQWWALIRDTHEGYISWKQFEEIQHMMSRVWGLTFIAIAKRSGWSWCNDRASACTCINTGSTRCWDGCMRASKPGFPSPFRLE